MNEALNITYRLKWRDFAALFRHLHENRPSTRAYEIVGSAVVALKVWILVRQVWDLSNDQRAVVAGATFVIFFLALHPLEIGVAKLFDAILVGSRADHVLVIFDAGIIRPRRPLKGLHPWVAIELAESADHFFFTLYRFSTLVVPRRAFPEEAEAQRFFRTAVAFHASARAASGG